MSALRLQDVSSVEDGRRVLDRIDLDLAAGQRLAVIGPNGSGKSLLARICAGLSRPASGSVRVFGEAWEDVRAAPALRRRVGVGLAAGALLSELSPWENVRFQLGRADDEAHARTKVDRTLADAGAEYCADWPLRTLSAGERRRVDLARLLVTDPELLILDDVLAGVDEDGAEDLLARLDRLVEGRGRALLWIGGPRSRAERLAPTVLKLETGRLSVLQHAA